MLNCGRSFIRGSRAGTTPGFGEVKVDDQLVPNSAIHFAFMIEADRMAFTAFMRGM